jgi:tRNA pseudouridine32 synthase / 23S rRNA pseudouridine746 synthase
VSAPGSSADGVGVSRVWLAPGPWTLLLDFLDHRFPDVGRSTWQQRLQLGKVRDASGATLACDAAYVAGQHLSYYRELPAETPIPFAAQILYRDDDLLVADKPHFLPTIPAGRYVEQSLLVRLRRETGLEQLAPLHRLDRETAGLVLFSTRPQTRAAYSALFAQRRIRKSYEALAPCLPGAAFPLLRRSRIVAGTPFFRMCEAEGEANTETSIALLEAHDEIARYRLQPHTGKKHQLRLHMAAIGASILNDRWYPQLLDERADDYARPLKLLAHSLQFHDPLSGKLREFESRLQL